MNGIWNVCRKYWSRMQKLFVLRRSRQIALQRYIEPAILDLGKLENSANAAVYAGRTVRSDIAGSVIPQAGRCRYVL